jgi:hypothetical protein
MAIQVGINGFGRIGRLAFRQMFRAPGYEIVAINDLTDAKMLAHLLKYDSSQGRYALGDKVTAKENSIVIDGDEITIYSQKNPEDIPWAKHGVDVVLECTGFFATKEKVGRPHQSRRKEGYHFLSRGRRPAHNRFRRERTDVESRRYDYFRRFLHHKLPRPHGVRPQQSY